MPKISSPPGFDSRTVQPVARRHLNLQNYLTCENLQSSPHAMKSYKGNKGKAPLILKHGTTWSCWFKVMLRPLYAWYLLNRRLGGWHSQSGRFGDDRNVLPPSRWHTLSRNVSNKLPIHATRYSETLNTSNVTQFRVVAWPQSSNATLFCFSQPDSVLCNLRAATASLNSSYLQRTKQ